MKAKLLLLLLLANFSISAQNNLVQNEGFEDWPAGLPANWTTTNSVNASFDAASGLYSTLLSFNSLSPKITTQVALKAGVTYTVRFKYKYVSANYSGDHPIALNISQNGSAATLSSSTFAVNNLWNEKITTFTADQDLSYDLSISLFSFDGAFFGVLIDAVEVYVVGTEQTTKIPDVNFENKLISLGLDSGDPDGKVLTRNISAIKSLNLSRSSIADLTGIEDFVGLTQFWIQENKLTSVDLSHNVNIYSLECGYNLLETLDLSHNTKLTNLGCSSNKLTNLNVSSLTDLYILNCGSNQLTSLDLSNNTKLETFYADSNKFTALDLSKNTALNVLKCGDNYLMATLNLQNGKNNLITSISLKNTPSLYCLLVDDVDYANMNWTNKDDTVNYSLTCPTPEYVLIPDIEFEKALMSNRVDGVLDGKVLKSKVLAQQTLRFEGNAISDLTGLESFVNLKSLDCSGVAYGPASKLTKLNVSALTHLTTLDCSFNNISTIDVSNNLELKELNVRANLFTSVDVSNNLALETLWVATNKIPELDVTKNTALKILICSDNPLTEINVSKNTALSDLSCLDTNIKTLDLSNNTALQYLDIERNDLKILDLSKNLQLLSLNASQNNLKSLDISKNTLLTTVSCYYNFQLEYLNLKNGNNKNFKTDAWNYGGFTNLKTTCIEVDDVDYSNANWAKFKDADANYSNSCPVVIPYTLIPDTNFENKLIELKIDKDGLNGKVATSDLAGITTLDVSNSNIRDLTGLNDFVALKSLNCSKNQLNELNLYENTLLTNVDCSHNNILVLDLSTNVLLTNLSASFNKLNSLDVSKNTKLKEFDCAGNDLYSLNVKNGNNVNMQNMIFGNFTENPNLLCIQVDNAAFSTDNWIAKDLKAVYSTDACPANIQYTLIPDANFERKLIKDGLDSGEVDGKVLTSKISNVTTLYAFGVPDKITDLTGIEDFAALENLYCYHEAVAKINLSKNLKLKSVDMADNKVTALDLTQNINLESLNCGQNNLTTLNVSSNKVLKSLTISENQLTTIDVSQNTALERLYIGSNQFTNIDVTSNLALRELSVSGNKIATLNISKNTALTSLTAFSNELTAIDVTQNKNLTYLNAKKNQLTALDVSQNKLLLGLEVSENKIEAIDVSQNPLLSTLMVNSNQLTSLNLKNGANGALNNNYVSFTSNPKLYCILVDDVNYALTNWPYKKDNIATYNTECTGELVLPANNFTVETKGESCLGENNGEINIVGKTTLAYAATINDKTYAFTNNSLNVNALSPGIYKIKITIADVIFEQNFTVTIAKGGTITGKSNVTAKKVDVEITEGTAPFTVYVDGQEQFQTSSSSFSLDLSKDGLLEVATSKACEGVYSKKIENISSLVNVTTAYPNPTSGHFEIAIPTEKTEVEIELYNFSGQLVSHGTYTIESGVAKLNLEGKPSGIYAAKIYLETPEYIKIIKR